MSDKKIIFVSGANRGLGLVTVKEFCKSSTSYVIIMGARNVEDVKAAIEEIQKEIPETKSVLEPVQLDVSSDESITKAHETISGKYDRIDVLINNAGAQYDSEMWSGKMSRRDCWMKTWDVNVAGTWIVTETLLPLLLKSSEPRLLFVTSGLSSLEEQTDERVPVSKPPTEKGWPKPGFLGIPSYRSAKSGLNMMMREWARILKNDNVKVFSISPGLLATGLGQFGPEAMRKMGAADPVVGAQFMVEVAEGKRDEDANKVVRRAGVQPW